MKQRAFLQGISDSYSYFRQNHVVKDQVIHIIRCLKNTALYYLKSLRNDNGKNKLRVATCYWYGYAQHQLHVAINKKLQEYVLKDSYL